jgi:hypothetical protein
MTQCSYNPLKSWMVTKLLVKRHKEREGSRMKSFLDVVRTGRNLKTSFEADRVYAYLGNPLARKCGDGGLLVEPNYSKPFQEVYFETACSILAHPREAPHLLAYVDLEVHQRDFIAYVQAARHLVGTYSAQTQTDQASQKHGGNSPFIFAGGRIYAHKRCFGITEFGRFGLIPWLAKPNDVCCICLGMKVPLILRPREDGRYDLVGDSYVHGVMAWEVIEGLGKGEVKQENIFFSLRQMF